MLSRAYGGVAAFRPVTIASLAAANDRFVAASRCGCCVRPGSGPGCARSHFECSCAGCHAAVPPEHHCSSNLLRLHRRPADPVRGAGSEPMRRLSIRGWLTSWPPGSLKRFRLSWFRCLDQRSILTAICLRAESGACRHHQSRPQAVCWQRTTCCRQRRHGSRPVARKTV